MIDYSKTYGCNPPRGKILYKKFTPSDLKTGMVVVVRNGESFLVYGNRLIGDLGFVNIHHYNDSMEHNIKLVDREISMQYDIQRVYRVNPKVTSIKNLFTRLDDELLIWDRCFADNEEKKDFQKIYEKIQELELLIQSRIF